MKTKELLERVAPCSLMCYTCGAFEKGVVCETAAKLLNYMDGMTEFYKKHSAQKAENHNIFMKELEKHSEGVCSGCRNRVHHGCSIAGCFILECTIKHNVNFCGECSDFPCKKVGTLFEKEVYEQWLNGNEEIQKNGIEEFWAKNYKKPHYQAYK